MKNKNKHRCSKNCKGIGFEIVGKYLGETCNYCRNKIKLDEIAVYPHVYRNTQAGQSGWYHLDCVKRMIKEGIKTKHPRLKKCKICNTQKKADTFVTLPCGPTKVYAHVSCMKSFMSLTKKEKLKHIQRSTINRFSLKRANERLQHTHSKSIENIIEMWEITKEHLNNFRDTLEITKENSWDDELLFVKGTIDKKRDVRFSILRPDSYFSERPIRFCFSPGEDCKGRAKLNSMPYELRDHYEKVYSKRFSYILDLESVLYECLIVNETISISKEDDKFKILEKCLQNKLNDPEVRLSKENVSLLLSDKSSGVRKLATKWFNKNMKA